MKVSRELKSIIVRAVKTKHNLLEKQASKIAQKPVLNEAREYAALRKKSSQLYKKMDEERDVLSIKMRAIKRIITKKTGFTVDDEGILIDHNHRKFVKWSPTDKIDELIVELEYKDKKDFDLKALLKKISQLK